MRYLTGSSWRRTTGSCRHRSTLGNGATGWTKRVRCPLRHDSNSDTMNKMFFVATVLLCPSLRASEPPATENYLTPLQDTIAWSRTNLATVTKSAGRAAGEYLAGGHIWAAGRQADFIYEACGRAGGLMAIAPLGGSVPARHDIILYAVPGALEHEDLKRLDQWREKSGTMKRSEE